VGPWTGSPLLSPDEMSYYFFMPGFIDITLPFSVELPLWPGDPAPTMDYMKCISGGYRCNVTRLDTGVHFGTHLDAPCHFIDGSKGVDELDLDILVGKCSVIEIKEIQKITPEHLEACQIGPGTERLLIKTLNSEFWNEPKHQFRTDYAAITADAARWLVDFGIKLVGIDYLSIQLFEDKISTTHLVLLEAEVIIVEGLDLRCVQPGNYNLTCLPMKLAGADGAPVRALLEKL
jgi:arylformamidase